MLPEGGSRVLRRVGVLVLLAALSVPLVRAPKRIAIEVDGQVVHVQSYADTVDEALVAAGVDVGPADAVHPAGDAPVADGAGIEVTRAVPVTLDYEGRTTLLPVVGDTVEDVLVAAGIGDVRGLSVSPDPSTPLAHTRRVRVVDPVVVEVLVGERTRTVKLKGGRVRDALARAGVRLRRHDTASLPLDAPLEGQKVRVRVTRRSRDRVVEETPLPFDERVVETDELFDGEREVVQEGAEGLRRDVFRVTREDGEVVDRERVRRTVVREPVDRVVHVGTRPRPAPEPEPAPAPAAPGDSVWDRLAQCESGGNWHIDSTYDGGLQFHPDTWNRWKPSGYPAYAYQASREQQILVGKRLQAAQGWSAWPHCSRELGLR